MQKKGTKREMGNIAYWNYTIMLFLPLSLLCVQIYTKRTGIWERTKGRSKKGTPAVPVKTQRRGTECDYFGTKLIQILSRKCRTKKWTSVSFPTILPSFPALCYLICDLRSFSSFDLSCTIYVRIAYNIHIHVHTQLWDSLSLYSCPITELRNPNWRQKCPRKSRQRGIYYTLETNSMRQTWRRRHWIKAWKTLHMKLLIWKRNSSELHVSPKVHSRSLCR